MDIKFKDIAIIGGSVGAGYWLGFRRGFDKCRDKIVDLMAAVIAKSEKNEKNEKTEEES